MLELPVAQSRSFRPTIYWYTTFRCNLACKHCAVNSSPNVDTYYDLSTAEALRAVDNMADMNPAMVIITGGDPYVRPDALAIQQRLFDRGVHVGIETNATLINEDIARFLRRNLDRGSEVTIGISLDGGSAEDHDFMRGPGSFAATLRAIDKLREYHIPFHIGCVVNRMNTGSLHSLFSLAREFNASLLSFAFVNPLGRAVEFRSELELDYADLTAALEVIADGIDHFPDVDTVVKLPFAMIPPKLFARLVPYRQRKTEQGKLNLSTSCSFPLLGILPDGTVTTCSVTRSSLKAYLGNVKEESLSAIWENNGFNAMREQYVDAAWLTGICGDCVFKRTCKGSCRAWAYMELGHFSDPHPLCNALAEQGQFPNIYRASYRENLLAQARANQGGRSVDFGGRG